MHSSKPIGLYSTKNKNSKVCKSSKNHFGGQESQEGMQTVLQMYETVLTGEEGSADLSNLGNEWSLRQKELHISTDG